MVTLGNICLSTTFPITDQLFLLVVASAGAVHQGGCNDDLEQQSKPRTELIHGDLFAHAAPPERVSVVAQPPLLLHHSTPLPPAKCLQSTEHSGLVTSCRSLASTVRLALSADRVQAQD